MDNKEEVITTDVIINPEEHKQFESEQANLLAEQLLKEMNEEKTNTGETKIKKDEVDTMVTNDENIDDAIIEENKLNTRSTRLNSGKISKVDYKFENKTASSNSKSKSVGKKVSKPVVKKVLKRKVSTKSTGPVKTKRGRVVKPINRLISS
ncbi:unnamed protein product [Candida verbasci]|uniref:Uncharacterized protein n=1 Tax=Candida verbasci TaxID=1227364 RepID=A0A9W4XCZ7_9ASCO|nr:unnamed protein product [Candida verbasci]